MSSGVTCNPDCINEFNELKLRKNHRYILYGIVNNDKEIRVVKKAPRDAGYDEFVSDLQTAAAEGHGRYAVYDYELPDDNTLPKLIFVVWAPLDISVRYRMLYASSKDAIKRKLVGIKNELQANDLEDISEEEMAKKAK